MLKLFGGGKPDHPMADPRETRSILEGLPADDPLLALEELAHWHESVAGAEGFKPEQRIALLIEIDDAAQSRVRRLSKDYFAVAHSSRFQENRLWTHVHEYWRQAANAFARSVDGFVEDAKAAQGARMQLPVLLIRALRSLAQQIKWTHLRYGPVDVAVWGMLNGVYAFAEKRKLADVQAAAYTEAPGESTPKQEFLKAALFSASSPDSLLPSEVDLTERLIGELARGFALASAPAPALTYWIDLGRPMAPQRVARTPQSAPGLRFFGGGTALDSLRGLIQKVQTSGQLPAALDLGGEQQSETALDVMQHLALCWSPAPPERRHARHHVESRLSIVRGFDGVMWALGSGDSPGFEGEVWVIENVSAGGFGAAVPQVRGDWLKVGALLAMQPEGGANWVVGLVRRVNKISGQEARVGIQTLSRSPVVADFDVRGDGPVQGVVLPSAEVGSTEACVLLRPALFVPGFNLESERGGRQYVYLPQGEVRRGEDYELVRCREMIRES